MTRNQDAARMAVFIYGIGLATQSPPDDAPRHPDAPRFGTWAVPRAGSMPGENALVMRETRCARVSRARRPATAVAPPGLPAYGIHPPCPLVSRHGVINVLCHDLPRRARDANISNVEREAMQSRCAGRTLGAMSAGTARCTAAEPVAAFIGRLWGSGAHTRSLQRLDIASFDEMH